MTLRVIIDNLSLSELSANLRLHYAASAQRQMLDSINTTLVLFESDLINTLSGEHRSLSQDESQSRAAQIAQAAGKLLPSPESASILLLLPVSDFIPSHFSLNISSELMLKSALKLQAATVLPAFEQSLLLAVNPRKSQGIALWYPQAFADELYQQFALHNLHLAAIMPRALACSMQEPEAIQSGFVLDEDEHYLSLLELEQGVLHSCLSMRRSELEETVFNKQWQTELARIPAQGQTLKLNKTYWLSLRKLLPAQMAYCFYPGGAIEAGKKLLARKQKTIGAFAIAALVVLLALPFVSNWVQIAYLNNKVDEYRVLSTDARKSQAAVYDMEEAWGAMAEYPQQDVSQVLLALNQLIEGSLSSFSINKGVIDISGLSPDPALLIEQLAELELFYNVGQSRSSSGGNNASLGDRFGIRMNLSGIDFPAYEANHPATTQ